MTQQGDRIYHDTLCLYYEEEVEGEAFFAALAARFATSAHKQKLSLLAAVERFAAQAVAPLIARHDLTPRPAKVLIESGRAEAQAKPADWDALIAEMTRSYPDYVIAFERLEAMAPAADKRRLEILTEHEVAAIAFLKLEKTDPEASTAPLKAYLALDPATWSRRTV